MSILKSRATKDHAWAEGPRRPVDRGFRAAYWLGFRILRGWWYLRRPDHRGALVAIWVRNRILMLRLSYRHDLNLPGGGIMRGETPEQTALRELKEEVGLTLDPSLLRIAWRQQSFWDYRQDHVTIFEVELGRFAAVAARRPRSGRSAADYAARRLGWPGGAVYPQLFVGAAEHGGEGREEVLF